MKLNDMFGNPKMEKPKMEQAPIKRTRFVEQTPQFMQGIEGAIQPIDIVEFAPNTIIKPSYTIKIKFRNPSIRPLKNSIKFHVHTYVAYKRQLDANYTKYMKGKSGIGTNNGWGRPLMNFWLGQKDTIGQGGFSGNFDSCDNLWTSLTPNSLANCFGIPWEAYTKKAKRSSDGKTLYSNNRYCFRPTPLKLKGWELEKDLQYEISHDLANTDFRIITDPFVFYQKVRRKFYQNYNLMTANEPNATVWFSDKENKNDFRVQADTLIPTEQFKTVLMPKETTDPFGQLITDALVVGNSNSTLLADRNHAVQLQSTLEFAEDGDYLNEFYINKGNGKELNDLMTEVPYNDGVSLDAIQPRMSKKSPYLNSLGFRSVEGDYFTTGSPFPNLMRDGVMPITEHDITNILRNTGDQVLGQSGTTLGFWDEDNGKVTLGQTVVQSGTVTNAVNTKDLTENQKNTLKEMLGINMKDIRTMATLTRFKERLARVNSMDGYNALIESNFKVNPKEEVNEPIYIGGFSGVMGTYEKQSTNTNVNEETPFGTVGDGEIVLKGSCGEFKTTDAGYYMTVISCQISNLYPRHLDRMWTTTEFEEMYFPDFNELEPQATLKREKSLAIASSKRSEPYNYVDRYKHMKSRVGNLCGFAQSKKELWDNAQYLQMSDEWEVADFGVNAETLHPRYLDNSPFITTTEPMFDYDILRTMDIIAPFPYKAEPAEILN